MSYSKIVPQNRLNPEKNQEILVINAGKRGL
jgi:hypothetical protein